jgi:hypothetical protein
MPLPTASCGVTSVARVSSSLTATSCPTGSAGTSGLAEGTKRLSPPEAPYRRH